MVPIERTLFFQSNKLYTKVEPSPAYYLLDPGCDLPQTRRRLRPLFDNLESHGWKGETGKPGAPDEILNRLKNAVLQANKTRKTKSK